MARPPKTWEEKQAEAELRQQLRIERLSQRLETKQYKELEKLNYENKLKRKQVSKEAKDEVRRKYGLPPAWAEGFYEKPKKGKGTFVKGFTKQFSQIARSIPRQSVRPAVDVRQIMIQQQQQRQQPQKRNFFEHGSELEVYGDEGLTFFDSTKRGNGKSTGSLFGIG